MKLTIWVMDLQNDKSLTVIHAPEMSHRVKETNHFFSFKFLSTESTAVNIQEMADRITELEVQSCDNAFTVKL